MHRIAALDLIAGLLYAVVFCLLRLCCSDRLINYWFNGMIFYLKLRYKFITTHFEKILILT
jgi:hypothetical protein